MPRDLSIHMLRARLYERGICGIWNVSDQPSLCAVCPRSNIIPEQAPKQSSVLGPLERSGRKPEMPSHICCIRRHCYHTANHSHKLR